MTDIFEDGEGHRILDPLIASTGSPCRVRATTGVASEMWIHKTCRMKIMHDNHFVARTQSTATQGNTRICWLVLGAELAVKPIIARKIAHETGYTLGERFTHKVQHTCR